MCRRAWRGACWVIVAGCLAGTAMAGGNICEPGEIPDVIVGDLHEVNSYGSVGTTAGFSVGTVSCNIGTCWLEWFQNNNRHPVIGQTMYRLKNGRFEQIGQSWLKHGFFALSQTLCFNDCIGTSGDHLGVHCSDPYSAGLNGQQSNLGPKFQVNATTGAFQYPFFAQGQTGNAIYKRLQVHHDDLNPALNAGALYFVEGQYVTPDDSAAGAGTNNASYRPINVFPSGGTYAISLTGTTKRREPAINAWGANDPGVDQQRIGDPDGGQFISSAKATDLGNGMYHYEYALYNINSHRSAGSFTVPLPWGANVENVGFHDVAYHSGEPYDGTDWEVTIDDFSITWHTVPFDVNQNANALRWGTTYNFRFDADVPPDRIVLTIGLFRPGALETLEYPTYGPRICNLDGVCDPGESCSTCFDDCSNQGGGIGCCGDGTCDIGEDPCTCLADCGPPPSSEFLCSDTDDDCDALADCNDSECCFDVGCSGADADDDNFQACDCDDANEQAWFRPEEVENVVADHDPQTGTTTLSWMAPLEMGGTSVSYETIRSSNPVNFVTSSACMIGAPPENTSIVDVTTPPPGEVFYYVTRAVNACPGDEGEGSLGRDSNNIPREGRSCP